MFTKEMAEVTVIMSAKILAIANTLLICMTAPVALRNILNLRQERSSKLCTQLKQLGK